MTVRPLVVACVLLAGCKSADKGGPLGLGVFGPRDTDADQRASVDPLLTNGRIPPQDLPVPGRDRLTVDATRDPLLGSPAARDDRPDRTDRAAAPANRTPPRPNETGSRTPRGTPYRPGVGTTPAALASRIDPHDPRMRVGDDPPPIQLARPGRSADDLLKDLKGLGATAGMPTLERGEYVARGEVEPDPAGRPGQRRAYEAAGASREIALRALLEAITADMKK